MEEFNRLINLIGTDNYNLIKNKKVMVLGLGGVGGYAVESLVRSGIENIVLVDFDTIDKTNVNRQIIALQTNIGNKKTSEFKHRILEINPKCQVEIIDKFIDENNVLELINHQIDYIIDACDTINTKKLLIKYCYQNKIKLLSVMGMGNKLDPTKIEITSLDKTSYDAIAKKLRKYVKDTKIKDKIMVVSSKEQIITKHKEISSNSYVPSVAGLYCTFYVISDIIKMKGR